MKSLKKIVSILLVVSMIVGIPSVATFASESVEQKELQQAESDENREIPSDVKENELETMGDGSHSSEEQAVMMPESVEQKQLASNVLEYVYLDEEIIKAPQNQNIVVSFKDAGLAITSIKLYYQNMAGEELSAESVAIAGNVALFTLEYAETSQEDLYTLVRMEYTSTVAEDQVVVFADENINLSYQVTTAPEQESDISAYTLGESGEIEINTGDSITDVVQTALPEEVQATNSRARSAKAGELVVAVTAGHGGGDPGAEGYGLRESDLTGKVVTYFIQELGKYNGVKIVEVPRVYSGTNTVMSVYDRVQYAVRNGANVFLDFHFNAGGGTGAEIYYPGASTNSGVNQEGKNLAELMLQQLTALGLANRGAKIRTYIDGQNGTQQDYYGTIRYCKQNGIPGLVVEHAFMDNPSDANRLKDEGFLKGLGVADATAVAQKYNLSTVSAKKETTVVSIVEQNDFLGSFKVRVSGEGVNPGGVEKVLVPVWSEKNGQDDVTWYTASYNASTASYEVVINKSSHKGDVGKYIIHAYVWPRGKEEFLLTTACTLTSIEKSLVASNPDGKETDYSVNLTFPKGTGNTKIGKIQAAVWSEKGGQDDIIWYNMSKKTEQVWSANVPIKSHKTDGIYKAHLYATLENGSQVFLGETGFKVSTPQIGRILIKSIDKEKGIYELTLSGIQSAAGVSGIQVPVWNSGVADIYWHQATKVDETTYKVIGNISQHQYKAGKYQAHTYLTAGNGVVIQGPGTFWNMELPKVSMSVKDQTGTESSYLMSVSNAEIYGSLKKVQFATWSESGGQDDIVWYEGSKTQNGWQSVAKINNHKTAGVYNVHIYATRVDGSQIFLGNTTFNVSNPTIGRISVQNINHDKGTFELLLTGIGSKSGIANLQVPVWIAGVSDINWYQATKVDETTYKVLGNISKHQYKAGKYQAHTYLTAGNGVVIQGPGTFWNMELPKVSMSVKDQTGTESSYLMSVSNAEIYGSLKKVQFATWSESGGQDDIVWYEGSKTQNGWQSVAKINNHKTAGVYNVHIYATRVDGSQIFLGNTTFNVSNPTIGRISVQNINHDKGTFELLLTGIGSKSGVVNLQVPVWIAGVTDINWYQATKVNETTYKVSGNISKHKFRAGKYQAHTYLTAGNGVVIQGPGTFWNMELPKVSMSVKDQTGTESSYIMSVSNAEVYGSLKRVQFATWSESGGQDDIVWYEGSKTQNGWQSVAQIKNHKTAGTYNVHIYATRADGSQVFLGNTTFKVSMPTAIVNATNYNTVTGSFKVIISSASSLSGVESISVPVWSKSDQSNVVWYPATKVNNTYVVNVDPANHQYQVGVYNVHVYLSAGNGIQALVGNTEQQVSNVTALYGIMGSSSTSVDQMVRYYEKSGNSYPSSALGKGEASTLRTFCQIYYEEASIEGVKAEVAFAQAMKETGWLRYGGIVKIEQYNFAGIGALDGNAQGNCASFKDVRTGIRAQIQHLKAYASNESLKQICVDPRFHLVRRETAPYVQWLGIKENPYGVGWATGVNYGYSIVSMIGNMKQS